MFMWTRRDFAHEIVQAKNRGVKVEVVIDNHNGHGAGASIVDFLKKEGVNVSLSKGNGLLHHKMMVVDNHTLVIGSANWTKRAFKENDDCFLILTPLKEAQQKKLEGLWKNI
jgi:phosphatidylserine/phosphatidylglycerophosphate/cardiolipin synthase-like enzyme